MFFPWTRIFLKYKYFCWVPPIQPGPHPPFDVLLERCALSHGWKTPTLVEGSLWCFCRWGLWSTCTKICIACASCGGSISSQSPKTPEIPAGHSWSTSFAVGIKTVAFDAKIYAFKLPRMRLSGSSGLEEGEKSQSVLKMWAPRRMYTGTPVSTVWTHPWSLPRHPDGFLCDLFITHGWAEGVSWRQLIHQIEGEENYWYWDL